MNSSLRTIAAGAAGALLAATVVAATPAVADQVAKIAPKNSVTSKSIKNGTIKTKDLSAAVAASLAKADTALQGIPDNSVTNPKLADNAVGSAEVAADSLGAADLAADSVGTSELAANAVSGGNVSNHSLALADYSFADGFEVVAVPGLADNACADLTMDTGVVSLGGLLVVTPSILAADGLLVEGASYGTPVDIIQFRVCNRSGGAFAGTNVTFLWGTLA
jgi:hypothetical protein